MVDADDVNVEAVAVADAEGLGVAEERQGREGKERTQRRRWAAGRPPPSSAAQTREGEEGEMREGGWEWVGRGPAVHRQAVEAAEATPAVGVKGWLPKAEGQRTCQASAVEQRREVDVQPV